MRITASMGVMASIANALLPGSVETDPRSTNFMAIKVGDTKFKFGIGEASLITLASRIVPTIHNGEWGFWYKNSNGIYTKYQGDYGQRTPFDFAIDFLSNKTAPFPAGVAIDYLKQSLFGGEKLTAEGLVYSTSVPISVQNAIELKDDNSASAVLGVFADVLGVSANTYPPSNADWTQSTSKEMTQFKEQLGEDKLKEASDKYNKEVSDWLNSVIKNETYKSLSDEDKQRAITKKKGEIKDKILKEYGFEYKAEKLKELPKL
jgi:hypothetical protein